MTAQKGKNLLLKVDSDGSGTFVTVGGLGLAALGAKVDDAAKPAARKSGRSKGV